MDSPSMDEEGGSSPVAKKTISRRKKSPAQIECLERLYAENKYPSEEARAKLSAQIGLSEKQMQIWFTHRRHKDRKEGVEDVKLTFYAMRHKGGEAHLDFMEGLNNGKKVGANNDHRDDTIMTNGYRSDFYPGSEPRNGHCLGIRRGERYERTDSESTGYSDLGEPEEPNNLQFEPSMKRGCVTGRKSQPVGRYFLPNARRWQEGAVAAIEAQIGGTIRKDGPTLGVEFDGLPPQAWTRYNRPAVPTMQGRVLLNGRNLG